MAFDYHDLVDEETLYRSVQGVRNHPTDREAKPYSLVQIKSSGRLPARVYVNQAKSHYWPDAARVHNQHTRRVRGKVAGMQHFSEAIVEFKGLKRQLWSLLDQGLKTITRRRGGFHMRDILARESWKQTPTMYLLWQFALAPLISQIKDTLEKLAAVERLYYGRVSTGFEVKVPYVGYGAVTVREKGYIRKTTVFYYRVDNNCKAAIMEFLGVNRPITAIWDLTGWSWAVDYFFNLGELLANLDGDPLTRTITWVSDSTLRKVNIMEYDEQSDYIQVGSAQYNLRISLGWDIVYRYDDPNYVAMAGGNKRLAAECVVFDRYPGEFSNSFIPELKFKPTFGTFQFANLASAIAISIRRFEVDPQFLQPFKKGSAGKFKPRKA